MSRLFFLIYSIVGSTCAGIAVVVTLVIGQDTLQPILVAAAIGAALGVVASWIVAQKILSQ